MSEGVSDEERYKNMDAIYERVEQAIEGEQLVWYSVCKEDDNGIIIDNLDEVAIEGKVYFFEEHTTIGEGQDYYSPVVSNPTGLEVAVLANEMIKTTGDIHHIFLEGVNVIKEENGIQQVQFLMGS